MAVGGYGGDQRAFFNRRMVLLGGAQGLLFAGLAGQMYYLQVMQSDQYALLAEENRINMRLLAPLRGRIVDRHGTALAANRQYFSVLLIPEETPDVARVLDRLGRLAPLGRAARERILDDVRKSPGFVPVTVMRNLTWEQFARINVHGPDLPGVQPRVGATRHYPLGGAPAHVVGYVAPAPGGGGDDDPLLRLPDFRVGRNGIEKHMDRVLRGAAGASRVEVNASGRVIRELTRTGGVQGAEVMLTMDAGVQARAAERLDGESGAIIVMDVHGGDVIAMVSAPSYDPNAFNIGLDRRAWEGLLNDPRKPLLNKALAGQYPPGSVFKLVMALAALESGLVDPRRTVACTGVYTYDGHDFHCWREDGHGSVDMRSGIKQSCDIYFYDVARRIGLERITAMARRLGLGNAHPFPVPGQKPGLLPSRRWKREEVGSSWQGGDTLVMGIGQGYVLATPLQLAVMTSRIANGGYGVIPRVLQAVDGRAQPRPPAPPLGLAPRWLRLLHEAMFAVSNEVGGTAYGSRIGVPGREMAGKTGTSQVRRISREERRTGVLANEELEWRLRDHALFVAHAPAHAPRYAVAVIVEHGGSGSAAAAPVARDVMAHTLARNPAARRSRSGGGA